MLEGGEKKGAKDGVPKGQIRIARGRKVTPPPQPVRRWRPTIGGVLHLQVGTRMSVKEKKGGSRLERRNEAGPGCEIRLVLTPYEEIVGLGEGTPAGG